MDQKQQSDDLYNCVYEEAKVFLYGHNQMSAYFVCKDGYCFSYSEPLIGSKKQLTQDLKKRVAKKVAGQKEHPIE